MRKEAGRMNDFDATDLLRAHENAICLFTRRWRNQGLLAIHEDGTGESGNWRIGGRHRRRPPNKVVLYIRQQPRGEATVIVADWNGFEASDEAGRSLVRFSGATTAGTTCRRWTAFNGGGRGPVRYIAGRGAQK
jgi:hypothetical protein